MNNLNVFGASLSDLIKLVQSSIPDFITLAVSPLEESAIEPFYMKINDIYVPLDYHAPSEKVNDLIDFLHNYVRYKNGVGSFGKPTAFGVKNYFRIEPEILYEILRNLAGTPGILFISKNEWYIDVVDSGVFYPLRGTSASEFVDYLNEEFDC